MMIALSLISMIGLSIGGPFVIRLLLGASYEASIPVLLVHCLSALPYFLNEWRHAVCVAYDRAQISALLSWIGLVINVVLNLIWIPQHGALGSAWATLLAYSACSLAAPWLIPDLRWFARLQWKALLSPLVWISRPRHAWAEFQSMLARNAGEVHELIATNVISPFVVPLKITLMAAFMLALPVVLYQVWAFVAPGLYTHEKKLVLPLVVSSTLLFLVGVAFCYYFVFGQVFK